MRVRYTPRAQDDLFAIHDYLDERNPSGALNVLAAIHRAITLVATQPESSRLTDDPAVRMKLVTKYQYKIFYRVTDHIEILYIRHGARRPWGLEER